MNAVEYHFILVCPFYNTLRGRHIKFYCYNKPSTFKLIQLLSVNNSSQFNKLRTFLDKATKFRIDNSSYSLHTSHSTLYFYYLFGFVYYYVYNYVIPINCMFLVNKVSKYCALQVGYIIKAESQ